MRILLVAAMRSEVAGIFGRADVCITGVGVHQARERLREALQTRPRPGLILNAGLSGALRADLAAGDLVVADRIVFGESVYFTTDVEFPAHRGPIFCSQKTIGTRVERERIAGETGAICVDMESGAVAEVASDLGIPVAAIRAVMDEIDDPVAAFASPRDEAERQRVRELIRSDVGGRLGAKAKTAVDALHKALAGILGIDS